LRFCGPPGFGFAKDCPRVPGTTSGVPQGAAGAAATVASAPVARPTPLHGVNLLVPFRGRRNGSDLLSFPDRTCPAWATFRDEGLSDIFTIKPDGTSLKRLTNGKGNDAHMSWSFDGESIAFASSRMGFKDEVAYTDAPQPYGEIFVMRYDGTHVEQLTDNQWEEGTPGWEPLAPSRTAGR
jgi:hypothetical protein